MLPRTIAQQIQDYLGITAVHRRSFEPRRNASFTKKGPGRYAPKKKAS